MNTPRPTWRTWTLLGAAIAVYIAAGFWLSGRDTAEEWLYRTGLLAASVLPLLFVVIYTVIGIRRKPAAAWWRDEIGTALVLAALSVVPVAVPLCWVFWFDGGNLTSSWLAWLEVSGPCLTAVAWAWLCWVWTRTALGRR